MKDLKDYIGEAIKPPRLSHHNKDIWKGASEEAIRLWLEDNTYTNGKIEIVDGKINVYGSVGMEPSIDQIMYPFGIVTGNFSMSYSDIKSFNNCPEEVGRFNCAFCDNIKSLKGFPRKVNGDIDIRGTKFTEKDIKKVCKVKGNIFI